MDGARRGRASSSRAVRPHRQAQDRPATVPALARVRAGRDALRHGRWLPQRLHRGQHPATHLQRRRHGPAAGRDARHRHLRHHLISGVHPVRFRPGWVETPLI